MEKFDFFMLNPKFLVKSINDLLSEMSLLKNEYSNITKEHETQCKQDEQKSKELAEAHEAEIIKIEQNYQKIFIEKEEKIVVDGRRWCPPTYPQAFFTPFEGLFRATPRAPAPGPRINLANNIYRVT